MFHNSCMFHSVFVIWLLFASSQYEVPDRDDDDGSDQASWPEYILADVVDVTTNGACSEYDMFILGSRRLPTLHLLHHPLLLGLFLVILDLYQNLWLINEKVVTTFHVGEAMLQTINQIQCQQREACCMSPIHQIPFCSQHAGCASNPTEGHASTACILAFCWLEV